MLNVDGYYNSLLCFIDKAVDEGFIAPAARHIIVSSQTAQELIRTLEVFGSCLNLIDKNLRNSDESHLCFPHLSSQYLS